MLTTSSLANDDNIALARNWADLYRSKGLNPLPSRPDAKRPVGRYAQWWDASAPANLFERFPTTNIQVMTGRHWRLLVLDLDGPEAREWLKSLGHSIPQTWAVHSGGAGLHFWFRLPKGYGRELPKAILWKGEGEHSQAERLCDRSLVMAPPSIHPTTGRRYRFLSKEQSPIRLAAPALAPAWLLALPSINKPIVSVPLEASPRRVEPISGRLPSTREILERVPNKLDLARQWGVRFDGRPSPSGWHPCHAIDRPDQHPSAAVHSKTGSYCDLGSGQRLRFLDLAVAMGVYADWKAAAADIARSYGVIRP